MEAVGVCPDCLKWSRKYSKIDAGRNVLRQTVAILEKRLDEFTQLNSTLNKEVEELRSQADIEKAARTKEYETRAGLEKEIADLKVELLKLQQCTQKQTLDTDQQVTRVSDLENEIQKLNKLLDEEKSRVDTALKNVQVEKAKAAKAQEAAKLEKSRAGKEKSRAATEAKRAQEYKTQLDALKNEAAQTRSQLTLAVSKSEEANSRLEAERKKTSEEQQRARLMNTEAEKLKSLVETYEKKLAYEKQHADTLTGQFDEERKKNEEMLKTMDVLQEKIKSLEASSKYLMMRSNTPDDKGANTGNLTTLSANGASVLVEGMFDSSTTSSNRADGSSLQMTDSRLCGDVTELMHSVLPAMVSKSGSLSNAIPSGGPVHCKKRKRILSLLESVQYGLSDSRKIQMQMEEYISILRTELQKQMERPVETNSVAWNNQYDRFDNSCKKKEVLRRQKVSSQGLHVELDNGSPELEGVTADLGIGSLAIVPANNLSNGSKGCKSTNVASSNENSHNPSEFVAKIDGDYMVLLDLDDHYDERRYRVARENLLSSSLPEINYHGCNVYSVDGADPDHTIMDSSNAGLRLCSPNCIPRVDHVDDSLNLKEHDTWPACTPMVRGDAADFFSVKDIGHGSLDVQVEGSSFKVIVSKETRSPCETLYSDDIANLCVVHSETIDRANLCKVFDATRKGASLCHLSSPPVVLLKRVLDYIESNDVPPEQKACVFFSMILAGNHGSAARELSHPIREFDIIPNSYIADIFSAINNVDIRNCLAQTLSLHELLNFIAEFIMERKLWVCRTPDRNLIESDDSSDSALVDNMKLSLEAASTEQLVVASTILASLCVSFDEIDFIVFLSYNLFRLQKYDYIVALSVIHVFAQLSGRKFLTSTSNSLLADVVNSLISVLESSQSPSKRFFSEEVSLDTVINLLLERLQSLMEMAKTKIPYDDSQEEISYLGVPDIRSSSSLEEIFAQFTDVLSLLELIANIVSWDILSDKVVPQLLMKLKSSANNIFSVGIVTLLGQFGRLGVTASGPEDTWVVRIRCQLTGMMDDDSNRNLMHPIQVACACSLLKFINLDPNSLLCSARKEAPVDKASPACEIRRWFTSLSEEQRTIFMGILKEAPPV